MEPTKISYQKLCDQYTSADEYLLKVVRRPSECPSQCLELVRFCSNVTSGCI